MGVISRKFNLFSIVLALVSGLLLVVLPRPGEWPWASFLCRIGVWFGLGSAIIVFGLRRIRGEVFADSFLKNLSVLMVTVVCMLFIGELVVRFVFRGITTTGDTNTYLARRWTEANVHLNQLGFRDKEVEDIKPAGVYRIAVIGDSFTFGQGIKADDRFTNLVEKSLNSGGNNYRVLNFGRQGTETVDHLETLRKTVLRLKPDFVLLQWYVNDFEGRDKSGLPQYLPLVPSRFLSMRLNRSSVLYYLINRQWKSLQASMGLVGSYADYMAERFKDPNGPDSVEYAKILREFIELCKKEAMPVGIVLFPDPVTDMADAYPLDFLHDRVSEICALEGIHALDLRSAFSPFAANGQLWVNVLDRHPGPLPNRIAAERLLETFGPVWASKTLPGI